MAGPGKKIPLLLVEGKVYLRDTRNGNIHQYEDLLANMSYMQRFVHGEEVAPLVQEPLHITLSGIDRAAEWDRLAAMKPADRDAELAKKYNVEIPDEAKVAENPPQPLITSSTVAAPPAPPAKPEPPAPPAPPAPPVKPAQ